ncbi:MAG: MBG domain-containing protein [Candidatus Methanomethylophilaceae archaeon]
MKFDIGLAQIFLVLAIACVGVAAVSGVFDEPPQTLTIVQDGEGTVVPSAGGYSVQKGETVTVTMTPARGYILSMVTVNGEETEVTDGRLVLTMDRDITVHVYFTDSTVIVPEPVDLTYSGEVLVAYRDNAVYTVSGASAEDAGTYTAVFSLRYPDFSIWDDGTVEDKSVVWHILPRQVAASDFAPLQDTVYNGLPATPALSPVAPMTEGCYTSVYTDNVHAGTASVTVTASGNFTGETTLTFRILPTSLIVSVTGSDIVYGDQAPAFSVAYDGFVNGETSAVLSGELVVSCGYVRGNDAGEYPITLSGLSSDDYSIIYMNAELDVAPYELGPSDFTVDTSAVVYNGLEQTRDISEVPEFLKASDIRVTYSDNVHAGTATIRIEGTGNCVGVQTYRFEILKRYVTFTSATNSMVYDGNPFEDKTVEIGGYGIADTDSVVFDVTGSIIGVGHCTNSFTYMFVRGSESDYNVVKTEGTLTVTETRITITVIAGSVIAKYDGNALSTDAYAFTGSLVRGDTLLVELSGSRTDVGSSVNRVVSVKVMNGDVDVSDAYTFGSHVDGTITVVKRSVVMTSGSASKTYDGTALVCADVTVSGDGFIDGEGAVFTVTGEQRYAGSSDNVFTYTLRDGTFASNYDITCDYGTLTVNRVSAVLTIESGSKSWTYDGTVHSYDGYTSTGSVLMAGDTLHVTVTGDITDVGTADNEFTYSVKNGDGTDVTGCYTIEKVMGELEVLPYTIDEDDFEIDLTDTVYNGQEQTKNVTPVKDFLSGNYTVTYSDNKDAGEALITVTGVENCDGSFSCSFVISKVSVTVESGSDSKVCDGTPLTDSTVTVTGSFVDGELRGYDFTGSQTVIGSSKNTFECVFNEGVDAGNYDIGYIYGTLTVTPVSELVIQADTDSRVYDGTPFVATGYDVTHGALATGDVLDVVLSGTITDAGSVESTVTSFTILRGDRDVSSYYVVECVGGTLTVTPRPLQVSDFKAIDVQIYTGSAIEPPVVSDNALVTADDYSSEYLNNIELGRATVTVTGTRNAMGSVELGFDIYSGMKVYVLKDGRGNTYDPDTKRLSDFGTGSSDSLYDLRNISPNMTPQTAELSAVYEGSYAGMHLVLVIGEVSGEQSVIDQENGLLDRIMLTVSFDGNTVVCSLRDAKTNAVDLGAITTGSHPVKVTLSFPPTDTDNSVLGQSLNFALGIGLYHQDQGVSQ